MVTHETVKDNLGQGVKLHSFSVTENKCPLCLTATTLNSRRILSVFPMLKIHTSFKGFKICILEVMSLNTLNHYIHLAEMTFNNKCYRSLS